MSMLTLVSNERTRKLAAIEHHRKLPLYVSWLVCQLEYPQRYRYSWTL